MITLAFYKGRGTSWKSRAKDWAIRFATGGQYSHVELIEGSADFDTVQICLSSSGRDGGVREKRMKLDPAKWDLVELRVDAEGPATFIRNKIGRRYDYPALIFSQFFALGRHNPDRWFCSEIVAASLGLDQPHRLSPQMLFEVVTWELRRTAEGQS